MMHWHKWTKWQPFEWGIYMRQVRYCTVCNKAKIRTVKL